MPTISGRFWLLALRFWALNGAMLAYMWKMVLFIATQPVCVVTRRSSASHWPCRGGRVPERIGGVVVRGALKIQARVPFHGIALHDLLT